MLQLGKINRLKVIKQTPFGYYLGTESNQVLLPNQQAPNDLELNKWLDVLVYNDADGQLVASFDTPKVFAGQCQSLRVVAESSAGAFVDWGMDKDILVPFNQQDKPMKVGNSYVVYVYVDQHTQRLVASSKLRNFLHETSQGYQDKQAVKAMVCGVSEMGYKLVLDNTHLGLLHKSECFGDIAMGDQFEAFIANVRDDGKINVCLQFHDKLAKQSLADQILEDLRQQGGSSTLTDKSDPQLIKAKFNVSKGAYKKAIGALFKQQRILLNKNQITLVE